MCLERSSDRNKSERRARTPEAEKRGKGDVIAIGPHANGEDRPSSERVWDLVGGLKERWREGSKV
jgi:hypothetical protein